MADLKEVFVSAGCQCCIGREEVINDDHLLKAFETIKRQFSDTVKTTGF